MLDRTPPPPDRVVPYDVIPDDMVKFDVLGGQSRPSHKPKSRAWRCPECGLSSHEQ